MNSAAQPHHGAVVWLEQVTAILDEIGNTQRDAIAAASAACADAIAADRLVHVFGAGHSRIPVEEMFPRYGSYPGFHPLVELSLTFHTQVVGSNGQRQAMHLETVPGLAEVILSNFAVGSSDVVLVFSASGLRTVPVEMALVARSRGAAVIAVTSVAQSHAGQPSNPHGKRLLDVADIVIDLCTPPADAAVSLDGAESLVGPTTSAAAIAVANMIKVETYERLLASGIQLPVITSATTIEPTRAKALFEDAYTEYARRLAGLLATERRDRLSPGSGDGPRSH